MSSLQHNRRVQPECRHCNIIGGYSGNVVTATFVNITLSSYRCLNGSNRCHNVNVVVATCVNINLHECRCLNESKRYYNMPVNSAT